MSLVYLVCEHAIWTTGAALAGACVAGFFDRASPQVGVAYGACFYAAEQMGKSLLNRVSTINEENAPVFTQRVKLCFGFVAGGTVMALTGYSWKLSVGFGLGILGVKSLAESCLKPNRTTLNLR